MLGAVNLADGEKTITLSGNSWAPNQKIEYAITISQGSVTEITYSPVVTDWGAEAETPIGAN